MIDLHTHILPGIDDGSSSLEETMRMIDLAVQSGTTGIVATPHCNIPGLYDNYYDEWYDDLFDSTKRAIEENFDIKVYPGMEVFLTYDIDQMIEEGHVITINQSRYMLVEFGFGENEDFAQMMLEKIFKKGLIPILAHVERFRFVQSHPDIITRLIEKGVVIQVNKGSFVGHFGKKEQQTAYYLLRHKKIHLIASDAHSSTYRTPYIRDVYDSLKLDCSKEYLQLLFEENPNRILNDEKVIDYR